MCSIMDNNCGSSVDFGIISGRIWPYHLSCPDDSRIVDTGNGYLGFHRLAIMGLTPSGMQPCIGWFKSYVCLQNGKFMVSKIKKVLAEKYAFQSESDCSAAAHMYREFAQICLLCADAEFVWSWCRSKIFIAARDPIGIRPYMVTIKTEPSDLEPHKTSHDPAINQNQYQP